MNWQPIETAPKDKTKFLAFGKGHGNRAFSYHIGEPGFPMFSICWWDWHESEKDVPVGDGLFRKEPCRELESWRCEWGFVPTHWMPLPAPPESDTVSATK